MRVAQEPDQVNPRVIVIIAVLAVLVTAGGVWGAWLLQRSGGAGATESAVARWGRPPPERNAIETSLFGSRSGPPREAEAHGTPPKSAGDASAAHLRAYGWRDKQLGTVFIPIDRAMLLYAAKATSTGGPPQTNAPGRGQAPSTGPRTAP